MKHEIEINGCVQTDLNEDEFYDAFIAWVEENGWFFGGGVKEYDGEMSKEEVVKLIDNYHIPPRDKQ